MPGKSAQHIVRPIQMLPIVSVSIVVITYDDPLDYWNNVSELTDNK